MEQREVFDDGVRRTLSDEAQWSGAKIFFADEAHFRADSPN